MNILKNPYYRASLSKSGFDMSCRKAFSTIVGFLQPFMGDVLSPGETVQLNDRVFLRSETMTTSPFTRIHYKTEYFFVPFPQLWSFFGSFYYGIKDIDSAALDEQKLSPFPHYPCVSSKVLDDWNAYITAQEDEDLHGLYLSGTFKRLCDGFAIKPKFLSSTGGDVNQWFPLYWFQAYQRVFDTFYRNDMYEAHDRKSYNVDDLSDLQLTNTQGFTDASVRCRFLSLVQPRYRNMPRDFYTNIQPSPIFNSLSVDSFRAPLGSFNNDLNAGANSLIFTSSGGTYASNINTDGTDQITDEKAVYSVGNGTSSSGRTVNAAQIRNLFAVEKLLQITQRTKKDYNHQTLAHFGYDCPEDIGSKVFYIGGNEGVVQITDVNATATTSGEDASVLGEVAGKGIGFSNYGRNRKFTAPWHGVLLGIFSIWPEVIYPDYVSTPLVNMFNRDHFYIPEFDRLGMTPLRGIHYAQAPNYNASSKVIGWNYRYSHLKIGVNRCWGNFMTNNRNWISKRLMFDSQINNDKIPLSFFYYSPSSLDDIMLVPFEPHPEVYHEYDTDPFDVDLDLKYYKSSTMSVYGLAQL